MNTTVRPQQPPSPPPRIAPARQPAGHTAASRPPSAAEIRQQASDIVKTGQGGFLGFGTDPDARMQALAERSKALGPASRQALVAEVAAQDSSAVHSWMTGDRLNRLTHEGRISAADRNAVEEGIASAYAEGHISYTQMQTIMGANTQFAPAIDADRFQAARGFLAGDSPTLSAARQQYLEDSFSLTAERSSRGFGTGFDSAQALTFMQDAGQQTEIAQAFARLDPDAQRAVAAEVGGASIGYNNSRSAIADLPDPLATLTAALRDAHPATTSEGQQLLTRVAEGLSSSSAYPSPESRQVASGLYAEVAQGRAQQLADSPEAHAQSLARVANAQTDAERALQNLPANASAEQIWQAYQANPAAFTAPTFTQYLELRGDQAQSLSGAAMRNDIGLAMGMPVTRAPSTPADEAAMGRGEFDFFDGDAGNAVRAIENQITQAGGADVRVAALPVTVASQEHGLIQTTVWRVETANGQEKFVDYNPATGEARTYANFDDWKRNNKLPPGEMTYARNGHLTAGADGKPQLEKANTPSTVDTAWESWIKPTLDGAAMVGGVVLLGAVVVGTGGTALVVGGALLGGYAVATGGAELIDRGTHGQSLGLDNAQARNAWLNVGAGALSLGAMGSSLRLASAAGRAGSLDDAAQLARMAQTSRGLNVAAQYADTAAVADTGLTLAANWDRLTPTERTQALAMMAFWSAGMGISARQAGGVGNLYGVADMSNAISQTSQWLRRQLPADVTGVRVLPSDHTAPVTLGVDQGIASLTTPSGETVKAVVDRPTNAGEPSTTSALSTPRLTSQQALESWRTQTGIPAGLDTIAMGRTDVLGLQDTSYFGASPKVRQQASGDIPPAADGPIQSPSTLALFRNHAEQDVFNQFVSDVQARGITNEQMRGRTLDLTISNESGVCTMCKSGLGNPDKPAGIVKQISEMYPDLMIRVWTPGTEQPLLVLNGVKVQQ